MDTVVWQLLASVICPGYTIHSVVAIAHAGLLPIEVRCFGYQDADWVGIPHYRNCVPKKVK